MTADPEFFREEGPPSTPLSVPPQPASARRADARRDAPAEPSPPAAVVENLRKAFGTTRAVDDVSFAVAAGETFFLLGPSGCGKTTLLRLLAGLETPDGGTIRLFGSDVRERPPHLRGAPMVFQHYALWPHMTVFDNVAFGLVERGIAKADIASRVADALGKVGLTGFDRRRPAQLSGGQQQRVALARALVIAPGLLLLDEPLANLDAHLREEMRGEIARLRAAARLALVYVTHDQAEALALADRVAVMNRGKLAAVDAPARLYHRPPDLFTARFLGQANAMPGTIREKHASAVVVDTPLGAWAAVGDLRKLEAGARVTLVARPENVRLLADPRETAPNRFKARVESVRAAGQTLALLVRPAGWTGEPWAATVLNRPGESWRVGDDRWLAVSGDAAVALPEIQA